MPVQKRKGPFSHGPTYTGNHHSQHRTTTKLCFRQRGAHSSFNPLCSSFVYLLANVVYGFVVPSYPSQSQTQGGTRYTPHLTRFWTSIMPNELIAAIEKALQGLYVRAVRAVDGPNGELRCRIGALDARRVPFKGWAIVEPFATADGSVRSFCIMQRDE